MITTMLVLFLVSGAPVTHQEDIVPVSMDVKDVSLGVVIQELGKTVDWDFSVAQSVPTTLVTLEVKEVGFWDVIEKLAFQHGLCYTVNPTKKTVLVTICSP